jgi:inorganic pyrophosphatase/exopolyphosphatase
MEKTYLYYWHKSPDTDTICSASAYSEYLKQRPGGYSSRSGDLKPGNQVFS